MYFSIPDQHLRKRIEMLQEQLGTATRRVRDEGECPRASDCETPPASSTDATNANPTEPLQQAMSEKLTENSEGSSRHPSPTLSTKSVQNRVAKLRRQLDEAEQNIGRLVNDLAGRCDGIALVESAANLPSTEFIADDGGSDSEDDRWESHDINSSKAAVARREPTATALLCSEGMSVTKFCSRRLGSHECRLWLDRADLRLKWCTARVVNGALQGLMCKKLRLDKIERVDAGSLSSDVFRKNCSDELLRNRNRALTLTAKSRSLSVVFHQDAMLEAFLKAVGNLLPDVPINDERS
jgi:hypothetical protein